MKLYIAFFVLGVSALVQGRTRPDYFAGACAPFLSLDNKDGDTILQAALQMKQRGLPNPECPFYIASQKGNAQAAYELGLLFEQGRGLMKSPTLAAYWYKIAADRGYEPAKKKYEDMKQWEEEIKRDPNVIREKQ